MGENQRSKMPIALAQGAAIRLKANSRQILPMLALCLPRLPMLALKLV